MKSIKLLEQGKASAFFTSEDGHTKIDKALSVSAMLGAVAVAELLMVGISHAACADIFLKGNQCVGGGKPCGNGSVYGEAFGVPDYLNNGNIDQAQDWARYLNNEGGYQDEYMSVCAGRCGVSLDDACDRFVGGEIWCCVD